MQVRMHKLSELIPISRRVRQALTKLFTRLLEDIMKTLYWGEKSIIINGCNMSHLGFGDDFILVAKSAAELRPIA
ncbi:unnamed protein product [Arctia plantaginis]|uniref:Reverse transcriptase domain-containing protein n=1 Tax=Arctia plantaginis TaxID=874455 RepID=A0A8S1B675_ARCPL|nr:unnamed protein product [Arctia plantaginis]